MIYEWKSVFRRKFALAFAMTVLPLTLMNSCKDSGGFAGNGGSKKQPAAAVIPRKTESFDVGIPANGKVDVAFFLDTSDSMKEEIASLMGGLQRFADDLSDGSDGLDYQMFIIANGSKISPSLKDSGKLDVRNSDVNSHSALWNAYHFLEGNTSNVPSGSLNLRPDALKELVILTDDDATGITALNFGAYLKNNAAKLGAVRVSGFVGLSNSVQSSSCKIAGVGQSYVTLAADPAIGGMIADICNSNWGGLLNELALQVRSRAGKGSVVYLKGKPANAGSITVSVDGQVFKAFTYEADNGKLTLDATQLTPTAHKVDVTYE